MKKSGGQKKEGKQYDMFSKHGSILDGDDDEEYGSSDFEVDPTDDDYIFYEIRKV
jgi:hypothetical protein